MDDEFQFLAVNNKRNTKIHMHGMSMCSRLLGICCHKNRGLGFRPEIVQILCYDLEKDSLTYVLKNLQNSSLHGIYKSDSHLASFLKLVRNQFTSESSLFPRTPFSVILAIVIIFIRPENTDNVKKSKSFNVLTLKLLVSRTIFSLTQGI